ncbi:MAG: DUF192 domain-containing protein [bacterium]
MKRNAWITGLVALGIIVAIGMSGFSKKSQQANISSTLNKGTEIIIGSAQIATEVMRTDKEMARGLGGRNQIGWQEGMLFAYKNAAYPSFWMKDMRFPIDIVWIRENKVIGVTENIDPQIGASQSALRLYEPTDFIDNVLELHAGAVRKFNIKQGDSVDIRTFTGNTVQ